MSVMRPVGVILGSSFASRLAEDLGLVAEEVSTAEGTVTLHRTSSCGQAHGPAAAALGLRTGRHRRGFGFRTKAPQPS